MECSQDALKVATLAGELLLKNGAEITRIENTMGHILEAYGYPDYHVYAVANGIFATVNEEKWDHCSSLRNIRQEGINLRRVEAVNQISRQISRGEYTAAQAYQALLDCQQLTTDRRLMTAASGLGAGTFCYLMGGTPAAGLLAVPIGVLLQMFLFFLERYRLPQLISVVLGSTLATLLGAAISLLVPGISFESMVIGAIIPLVPGVAFTLGIRDLFNTHYLSGCLHLIEAVFIGICIALGVAMAIFLSGLGGVQL